MQLCNEMTWTGMGRESIYVIIILFIDKRIISLRWEEECYNVQEDGRITDSPCKSHKQTKDHCSIAFQLLKGKSSIKITG